MAVKKIKVKSKPALKSKKVKTKVSSVKKKRATKMNKTITAKPAAKSLEKLPTQTMEEVTHQITPAVSGRHSAADLVARRVTRTTKSGVRTTAQFNFMKAPAAEYAFSVGDNVEVFCDHEKNRERIRGWIKGIVVQVDNKLVAVQFRSNVFLTDGWMVPDKILWYSLSSEHIRPILGKKSAVKKDFIPEY